MMTLGQPEGDQLGKRDAFHLPCILVTASKNGKIEPGDSVRFIDSDLDTVERCDASERHGIADPFVRHCRNYFWVLLNPGTAQNLTHHFKVVLSGVTDTSEPENEDEFEDDEDQYSCGIC